MSIRANRKVENRLLRLLVPETNLNLFHKTLVKLFGPYLDLEKSGATETYHYFFFPKLRVLLSHRNITQRPRRKTRDAPNPCLPHTSVQFPPQNVQNPQKCAVERDKCRGTTCPYPKVTGKSVTFRMKIRFAYHSQYLLSINTQTLLLVYIYLYI